MFCFGARYITCTCRTHQLRVHMSHIGHPILGDTLYPIPAQYAALIQDTNLTIGTPGASADGNAGAGIGTEVDVAPSEATPVCDLGESAPADAPVLTAASAPTVPPRRVDALYRRLCLHALQLTFRHPTSGQQITLAALSTEVSPAPMPTTVPADHFATTMRSLQQSGSSSPTTGEPRSSV